MKLSKLDQLLNEVEALCEKYVGKKAEGETWLETCERLKRIAKCLNAVRRERLQETR